LECLKKEARGINNDDLDEVQSIGPNCIITMKGVARKKTFYIPKYLVEGYDGHNLFKISKQELNNKFPTSEDYNKYKTGAISLNSTTSPINVTSNIESHAPVKERKRTNMDDEAGHGQLMNLNLVL
jgi:hypothetical protein